MTYVLHHRAAIRKVKVPTALLAQKQYHEKQLVMNPQSKERRNFKAFRRQDEADIVLRHLQNDKRFHQTQHDFAVQGRRLTTIRQNILQQQICAFIERQIQVLQLQDDEPGDGQQLPEQHQPNLNNQHRLKSTFEVNIKAPRLMQNNLIENF